MTELSDDGNTRARPVNPRAKSARPKRRTLNDNNGFAFSYGTYVSGVVWLLRLVALLGGILGVYQIQQSFQASDTVQISSNMTLAAAKSAVTLAKIYAVFTALGFVLVPLWLAESLYIWNRQSQPATDADPKGGG